MMVFLSNSLSQYSTHYVEFSLKIVAKSSKLMPTMAISGLLGNSRNYEALDYLAALLLCVGTALFSSGGSKASTSTSSAQAVLGSVALFLSCIFDGLVPNLQQRVLQEASPEELMVRSNLLGALTGVLGIALSGDASDVLAYAGARPSVVLLLLGIGLSLAGSVRFYTSLVSSHGSVLAVAVGTLRKSCSLLLS
ncbi:Solute carrier family 35 member B1, partial [Durusdinium trenchii]